MNTTNRRAEQVDDLASGFGPALLGAVLSFGLYCLCLGGMFSNVDSRLILTTTETFAGLAGIRDTLKATTSYVAIHNPVGVDHVPFPPGPETRDELEDFVRRGLMPASVLALPVMNVSADPSILRRIMTASWCSSGRAIPNVLPARRTPGCQCIADAYLDLVMSTRPGTVNAGTVVTVPVEVRDRVSSKVYRCWDLRQVRRSRACGDACRTHVVGLPLFANIVLFLLCVSYLACVQLGRQGWNMYIVRFLIVVLGAVLCIPYYVRYPEANAVNLAGIAVCLFYIVVSLYSELDIMVEKPNEVNPLSVLFLVNLPLILSAHTVQLGVSGYGRDLWVTLSFGACGGLLGVLMQVGCFFLLACFCHVCLRVDGLTRVCSLRRGTSGSPGTLAQRATVTRRSRASPCHGPSCAYSSCSCCCTWRIVMTAAHTAAESGPCRSSTRAFCSSWRFCTSATPTISRTSWSVFGRVRFCRAWPSSPPAWPTWA